ncbi:MAG TPA: HAD family phosphatase [Epulopiscium sp.]|nr:HAD family phosphatase [Candidatus Epulonipiscium sp.]
MTYKMFVSDLDGTLLDDNHKISKENIEAIKKLEEKGIKFVIATGRTKFILEDILEKVDYKMPLIWSNGSAVSDIQGKILYTEEISVKVAREVIALSRNYNVDYMIHTLEEIIGESSEGRIQGLQDYNDTVKEEYKIPLKADKFLYDHLEKYNILKISLSAENRKQLEEFQNIIKHNIKQVNAVFSHPTLLDINATNSSKGAAVLEIAAQYNIAPHEIIAIGDNENDISMLKVCGLPLTLDNARDSVKAFAKHVTRDNNSSGVADAIERFVL